VDDKPYVKPTDIVDPQPAEQASERSESTGSGIDPAQPVSPADSAARGDDFSEAAGPQDGNATDTPASAADALDPEWRCKCGRPSTRWPGQYCDAHHVIVGTPGPALTTGLEAEHLPEAEDIPAGDYADRYADLLRRHLSRLFQSLDSRQPKLADLPLLERAEGLVEKLKALDARKQPAVPAGVSETSEDKAAALRRLAEIFLSDPDLFSQFITELLESDRLGSLHGRMWRLLAHFDQKGVPVWRDPDGKRDADDVVIL
jgi:hypothetical protein